MFAMNLQRAIWSAVLVALFGATEGVRAGGVAPPPPEIYWASADGSVNSSNLDGSGEVEHHSSPPSLGAPGTESARGVAFDLVNGDLYWADVGLGAIRRYSFDTGMTVNLITGLNGPCDVDVDAAGNRIYWTETGLGAIRSASLQGMGIVTEVPGLVAPCGLRFDEVGNRLFWTDSGTGTIQSFDLDGGGVTNLIMGLTDANVIDISVDDDLMFWADSGTGTIEQARLDGTDRTLLREDVNPPVGGIGFDPLKGSLFWSETTDGEILRATPPGGNVQVIINDPDGPTGLFVDFRRPEAVPTVSEWGVVVLLLSLCTLATAVFLPVRRQAAN